MDKMFNKLRSTLTSTVTEISAALPGNPLLREYEAGKQIGSAGPDLLWKIYSGCKKSTKAEVSIWVLEKKLLTEKYSKQDKEIILNVFKQGCSQLVKLKHPRILTVEHVLEESRESLVFCTEPIFSSLANLLGKHSNINEVPSFMKGYEVNEVEIKYGLIHVSEGLEFLHNSAKIIHGNICPENIVSTKDGFWKISGFDFTVLNTGSFSEPKHICKDWDSTLPPPSQPNPSYYSPERITTRTCSVQSDMYNVGMLLYAIYNNGGVLLDVNTQNLYREIPGCVDKLQNITSTQLNKVPSDIYEHIRMLLHPEPDVRPTAQQISKLPFFDSVGVRTLQYLDSLLQRDNLQRSQFFKSLPNVLPQLPMRVQLQRVIPALTSELSNTNMIPFVLPCIFNIAENSKCTDDDYLNKIFPCLIPVFKIQNPIQIIFQMLKKMDFLLKKTPSHLIKGHILPMISSALESTSTQIQDLSLSIMPTFAEQLDLTSMKSYVLPKIRKIILEGSTTQLKVNALVCTSKLMTSFDKWTCQDEILVHLLLVKSREPGILMAMLGVFKIAHNNDKLGITKEMVTGKVIPFLLPLAFEGSLNLKQFQSYMSVIKEMLEKVETEQRIKLEQISKMQIQEENELDFTKVNSSGILDDSDNKGLKDLSTDTNNLSLEDKKRLADMKAQHNRMKNQVVRPLKVNNNSVKANNVPVKTRNVPLKMNNVPTIQKPPVKTVNKPKDLTSTLMQQNLTSMTTQNSNLMTSQNNNFMNSQNNQMSQSKPNYMINSQQQNSFMTSQQPAFRNLTSQNGGFGGNNMMTPSVFGGNQATVGNNSPFGSMTSYSNNSMTSHQNSSLPRNKGDVTSLDSLLSFPSQQKGKPMNLMTSQKVNPQKQNPSQNKLTQQDLLEFLG